MAKAKEEISELLSTPLFKEGLSNNYISVSEKGDMTYIEYHCKNGANLSSANINVYHEIGYAMGIAESHGMLPNMILLYKENTDHNKENKDVDKFVGFNLRNLSQLRFKDYDQLVEGLIVRLEKHYGV